MEGMEERRDGNYCLPVWGSSLQVPLLSSKKKKQQTKEKVTRAVCSPCSDEKKHKKLSNMCADSQTKRCSSSLQLPPLLSGCIVPLLAHPRLAFEEEEKGG